MDKTEIKLDGRLTSVAEMVREGTVAVDVGTDHAYLPIYLIMSGKIDRAVASDVNKGPLERARINAEKYGLTEQMTFVLSDGLDKLSLGDCMTDIMICGMGGELIARIIEASEYPKRENVRLLLQPMSCREELRRYLARAGYRIIEERLSEAAGNIYTAISARYDGHSREFTEVEYLLGEYHIAHKGRYFREYAENEINKLRVKIRGKESGGHDAAAERELLREIENILNEVER